MYAQLGNIVFEPLSGFDSYNETDEAVIAQYGLITGKPFPQQTALGLREISVAMRLHQRFIVVSAARLQLRAYKDNGTTLTLTWGNGNVEGRFLIQSITTGIEESDNYGNVFCASLTLSLLEVPTDNLLAVKQADSYKQAFGLGTFATPVVNVPVPKVTALQQFLQYAREAAKWAALIDALAYGGRFPNLGSSLGQVIGNAEANIALLQTNFADFGDDYDIPDVSGGLSAIQSSLTTLGAIDPIADAVSFGIANNAFQALNRSVFY